MIRIFGVSIAVTVAALVVAFVYGGPTALLLTAILGVLEISLSFDNAVINATVLQRMNEFWQRMFLTVGVLLAVFGMRLAFPLVIVWVTAGLDPVEALRLALDPPTDGSPTYEDIVVGAHPQIAAFGGMFLLMLFLDFLVAEKEITWISWVERPLMRLHGLDRAPVVIAMTVLVVTAVVVAPADEAVTVMIAGTLGTITYLVVNGLGDFFHVDRPASPELDAPESDALEPDAPRAAAGPSTVAKAAGRAGFFAFLYLEVLDASFSFDGVIGAFAITADPILIALGLGLIGAMFVRSLTVYLVRRGTLAEYVYLEHGAHWAIGALALILLYSIGTAVPEVVTGLVGVVLIVAAFIGSVVRRRAENPVH
ncbi:DUF475 domain-containing protein [Gordonia shandongensis]|uniref:DUF475 domain-containing protein n=1 Tax=Gordonia shandongensis TaxID=376351 RepID=UPI00041A4F8E|nr:DUF475 domain-containing protein [Gordonia shandongensis]